MGAIKYPWGWLRPSLFRQRVEADEAEVKRLRRELPIRVEQFRSKLQTEIDAKDASAQERRGLLHSWDGRQAQRPGKKPINISKHLPKDARDRLSPEALAEIQRILDENLSGFSVPAKAFSARPARASAKSKKAPVSSVPASPTGSGSQATAHLKPLRPDFDEATIAEMAAGSIRIPPGYEMPISDEEIARRQAEGLPVPQREEPWKPEVDPQAHDPDLLPDGPNGTKLRPDGYMIDADNHILNPKGHYVRGVPPGDEIDSDWRLAFVRPAPDTASDDPPPRPVSKKQIIRSHPAYVAIKKLEDDLAEFIYAEASHPINMDLRNELLIELNRINDFRSLVGDAIEEERELPTLDPPDKYSIESVVSRLSRPLMKPADAKAKAV
jgi:hypothetical protein